MRKSIQLLISILIVLLFTSNSYAQKNYQKAIKSAYLEALLIKEEGTASLQKIHKNLDKLIIQDKLNLCLTYWLAYDEYYLAKYYELREKEELAESLLEKAINRLDALEEKSSEDYALLSLLQSAYLKYCNFSRISLAKKMAKNCQKALTLEPNNLRANVVWGIIDLARPKIFGGRKEGEKFLLNALENLSEQTLSSEILPSWGKEEAYETLIKYYIKVKRLDEARDYIKELETYYPMNLYIDELKKHLK